MQELLFKIHLNEPFVGATLSSLLSPFSIRKKSKGDNERPYLIPHSDLKKVEVDLLIRIAESIKWVQVITHAKKCKLKPKWIRMRHMEIQL